MANEEAVLGKKPMIARANYVGPKKDFMTVEDLLLPLSGDGDTVDMLMISLDYFHRD